MPAHRGHNAGARGVGNHVRVVETLTETTCVITYAYDPLNRLTGATYSTGESFAYQYDAVGNRTAYTETTPANGTRATQYEYDAANRLTKVGNVVYTWDARGNLTNDGVFTYTYSAAGRMVRAQSITATLHYTYNHSGLRVAQSVDGDVTTFAWDMALPLAQVLATSDDVLNLYGLARIGEVHGGEWFYSLGDALGSVRQWADAAADVTYAGGYTPFGVEMWQEGSTASAWGYTGEWQDAQVGLIYLRNRWMDPSIAAFLTPDSWPGDLRHPVSFHPYLYAEANPINLVDPLGLYAIGCSNYDAYNLTDWLVREMYHQSNHWPVQWGISLLNWLGRYYDSYDGPLHDMVLLSLLNNLGTYIPWNWDEHSYRNDISTLAYVGSSLWWAGMVKDGARWDFKDQIKDRPRGPGESIVLCDYEGCRWYEYSMPGNIFYAYVGRAAGFSEWDIRVGAIYAQQVDPENDPALNDWLGLDQATDQAALELGFTMYRLTQGVADEIIVRHAFKTALLLHKDRLAQGSEPTEPYVLPPGVPMGPDGPEFPLRYFDGENVMGWMGG